ncbi:hypothetical protein [Metallosphaera tengchongensis]|uniref:hypothetical protein n=1 Tax=Metallosphaera tengchongensis TaxID=1532350 RepID=UPI001C2E3B41|nr:hypothetical protein [Metallosphaera tengchongensis]
MSCKPLGVTGTHLGQDFFEVYKAVNNPDCVDRTVSWKLLTTAFYVLEPLPSLEK